MDDIYEYMAKKNLRWYYLNLLDERTGKRYTEHSLKYLGNDPVSLTEEYYKNNKTLFTQGQLNPVFFIREIPSEYVDNFDLNDENEFIEFIDSFIEENEWLERMNND